MKIIAIVQARMGSSRLPGKVLLTLDKGLVLGLLLDRLAKSKMLNMIVVATSSLTQDDPIEEFCIDKKVQVYRGEEKDVLKRYYNAAKLFKADVIVRITADCPLLDSALIDEMLICFLGRRIDYLSNVQIRFYPKGLDTEIFTFQALEKVFYNALRPEEREHVTLYLREQQLFRIENFSADVDLSRHRWTLDYPEDYYFLRRVYNYLDSPLLSYQDVLETILSNAELKMLSDQLNKLYI